MQVVLYVELYFLPPEECLGVLGLGSLFPISDVNLRLLLIGGIKKLRWNNLQYNLCIVPELLHGQYFIRVAAVQWGGRFHIAHFFVFNALDFLGCFLDLCRQECLLFYAMLGRRLLLRLGLGYFATLQADLFFQLLYLLADVFTWLISVRFLTFILVFRLGLCVDFPLVGLDLWALVTILIQTISIFEILQVFEINDLLQIDHLLHSPGGCWDIEYPIFLFLLIGNTDPAEEVMQLQAFLLYNVLILGDLHFRNLWAF